MKVNYILGLILSLLFSKVFAQKVTFTEHIAPIIYQNCTPCHRPEGAGPFNLITYEDVVKRAKFIGEVTQSRYMPPWRADHIYQSFAGERRLSDDQINTIRQWIEQKTPQGKSKKMPPVPEFPVSSQLGKPDVVLSVKEPFTIPGNNTETFVLFKIPFELQQEQDVASIELVPGNNKLVHHANYGIYATDASVDIYAGEDYILSDKLVNNINSYENFMQQAVYYNGWIPGSSPQIYPAEIGIKLPKRGVIILTMHYGPTSIVETDLSRINIFFKKTPVKRSIQTVSIGSGGIGIIEPPLTIPPDVVKSFKTQITAPRDLSLLYAWPHMHLLGKTFKAYAVTLPGDTIPLVRINDWNFRWQEAYRFKKMLKIPKDAIIYVEATYDNTAQNTDNPFNPPRWIFSDGMMETTDEMLNLILILLPYRQGDENISLEFTDKIP